ncbi:MAG: PAS domain-containing protein [Planctomycetota bacterium]
MITPRVQPINEPRWFEPHELFFSLTDEKGVIRYGNRVFTRVSGYPEHDLVGKPHSLIRHPDVPRCVFRLLWDYLDAGKTIAAYVKNLAADGRYYWVLAVVTPCRDGYLSVRLNPSTPYFEAVKAAYAETLKIESSVECIDGKQAAIDRSLPHLARMLADHGFKSYDEFMRTALKAELEARGELTVAGDPPVMSDAAGADRLVELHASLERLNEHLQGVFESLGVFERLSSQLTTKQRAMGELAPSLNILALNAHIAASQLGEEGAVLSVVSKSLGERSKEADRLIVRLMERMEPVCDAARGVAFEVEVAQIEAQVCEAFARELLDDGETVSPGVTLSLDELISELCERVRSVLRTLTQLRIDVESMVTAANDLIGRVVQMKTAQLNGKIDVASRSGAAGFNAIFEDIAAIIDEARTDCSDSIELLASTRDQLDDLLKLEGPLEAELREARYETDAIVSVAGH